MTAGDDERSQSTIVEAINKAIDKYAKANSETVDLASLDTAVKAKQLLNGDLQAPGQHPGRALEKRNRDRSFKTRPLPGGNDPTEGIL